MRHRVERALELGHGHQGHPEGHDGAEEVQVLEHAVRHDAYPVDRPGAHVTCVVELGLKRERNRRLMFVFVIRRGEILEGEKKKKNICFRM